MLGIISIHLSTVSTDLLNLTSLVLGSIYSEETFTSTYSYKGEGEEYKQYTCITLHYGEHFC